MEEGNANNSDPEDEPADLVFTAELERFTQKEKE